MTRAAAPVKLPLTIEERYESNDEIRVPATLEEYLDFADRCEYRIEYSNGNIISMAHPTDIHELIVANIIWLLKNLFLEQDNYRVYASSLGTFIPETSAHYKPDAVVLAEEPQFISHKIKKQTVKSVLNPFAVVEVFSDGTAAYDLSEKLPNFKQCPSLKYIIFVHQHKPFVTVYKRSEKAGLWLNEDLDMDGIITIEGLSAPVRHIYRQVSFSDKPPHPAK